jgi:PadR family transcriptional regulator, regulatory protein PadR
MNDLSRELMAATTKPILLSILSQGENYGYEIIRLVHCLSEGKLEWSDGLIYPVLHRLEEQKLIKSRWVRHENQKMRKYYALTKTGQAELCKEKEQWAKANALMQQLLNGLPCSS